MRINCRLAVSRFGGGGGLHADPPPKADQPPSQGKPLLPPKADPLLPKADPLPPKADPPVNRQMPVKTLPSPILRMRPVKK